MQDYTLRFVTTKVKVSESCTAHNYGKTPLGVFSFAILPSMEETEQQQRERLIAVLGSLEDLTNKQVSIRFIFLRGIVYGLGTVIGATLLISVVSFAFVQLFGVDVIDTDVLRNL